MIILSVCIMENLIVFTLWKSKNVKTSYLAVCLTHVEMSVRSLYYRDKYWILLNTLFDCNSGGMFVFKFGFLFCFSWPGLLAPAIYRGPHQPQPRAPWKHLVLDNSPEKHLFSLVSFYLNLRHKSWQPGFTNNSYKATCFNWPRNSWILVRLESKRMFFKDTL